MTQEQFAKAVEDRVAELLEGIKGLGSLYVEPGDLVIVSVDKDIEDEKLEMISRAMRSMFGENPGIIIPGGAEITVVKKSERKEVVNQGQNEWKPGPV